MPERRDSEPLSAPVAPLGGVRLQRVSVIALVLIAFVAAAWVASALWSGLLLGVLTAFALEPAYRRLVRKFPRHRSLMAAISVLSIAAIAMGLLAGLTFLLVREAVLAVDTIRTALHGITPARLLAPRFQAALHTFGITPAMIEERALRLLDSAAELASSSVRVLLGSTLSWVASMVIALITAYYGLKDRRPMERRLEEVLPLNPRTTRELVSELRLVGRGTLIGSALSALVQGVLSTIGYYLGGVPRAPLFGALTAVASLVPLFGTLLVWIPISVVLILVGRVGAGIFELAWGVLVTTTLVDYVIRPVLAGPTSRSHPLLFLIGIIGGVETFGAIGVIAGPLVMALFVAVMRVYRREVAEPARSASGDVPRDLSDS